MLRLSRGNTKPNGTFILVHATSQLDNLQQTWPSVSFFPDGVALEGLLLRLPGGHLLATAVVILHLYHQSLVWLRNKTFHLPKVCKKGCFLVAIYLVTSRVHGPHSFTHAPSKWIVSNAGIENQEWDTEGSEIHCVLVGQMTTAVTHTPLLLTNSMWEGWLHFLHGANCFSTKAWYCHTPKAFQKWGSTDRVPSWLLSTTAG